jgi:hypothetical protein
MSALLLLLLLLLLHHSQRSTTVTGATIHPKCTIECAQLHRA